MAGTTSISTGQERESRLQVKRDTRGINCSACSFMPTTHSFETENYTLVYGALNNNTTTLLTARFMPTSPLETTRSPCALFLSRLNVRAVLSRLPFMRIRQLQKRQALLDPLHRCFLLRSSRSMSGTRCSDFRLLGEMQPVNKKPVVTHDLNTSLRDTGAFREFCAQRRLASEGKLLIVLHNHLAWRSA